MHFKNKCVALKIGNLCAKHRLTSYCVDRAASGLHGSSGKLTGSTSSLNKLTVQGSNSRRSQSSSLLDMGNMSASDMDVADRTKFDKVMVHFSGKSLGGEKISWFFLEVI